MTPDEQRAVRRHLHSAEARIASAAARPAAAPAPAGSTQPAPAGSNGEGAWPGDGELMACRHLLSAGARPPLGQAAPRPPRKTGPEGPVIAGPARRATAPASGRHREVEIAERQLQRLAGRIGGAAGPAPSASASVVQGAKPSAFSTRRSCAPPRPWPCGGRAEFSSASTGRGRRRRGREQGEAAEGRAERSHGSGAPAGNRLQLGLAGDALEALVGAADAILHPAILGRAQRHHGEGRGRRPARA